MAAKKKQITIVGAGLTGALLGLRLGQRGYKVDLFERRPQTSENAGDSGRSINLALSRRGIDALKMVGMMEKVSPLLIPMKGRMLHLEDGSEKFSPYGQRADEVIYSVSRRDLNRLLVTRAVEAPDVNVVFERKCTEIDFDSSKLMLEDISSDKSEEKDFELLIGCDGAGSKVRRSLMEHVGGQSTSDFLDHDYKELEIPAGVGGTWQLEKEALHIWPRGEYMLIALPNLDGSFTVTLFLPKQGTPSFESLSDEESVDAFFEKVFPTARSLMPDLVEDFFGNPTGRLGTVRCQPWHLADQCLILGDAAHAIVPFHGQGMNCAFEDCLVLDRLLEQHDQDWGKVNADLSANRKPDADAIAQMAIENYTTMRSTVTDPKYGLKKAIGFELERRLPESYIPRYSMVMFHDMPYAEALRKGEIQKAILNELVDGIESIDELDWESAMRLVKERI